GTMYLGAGEQVALFEPNVVTGNRIPAHTFVEFKKATWQKMDREQSPIGVTEQHLDEQGLRVTATIQNLTALPVLSASVTALLYDANGNLVNASQTIVTNLLARASKDLVFTWPQPFTAPISRVDIVP